MRKILYTFLSKIYLNVRGNKINLQNILNICATTKYLRMYTIFPSNKLQLQTTVHDHKIKHEILIVRTKDHKTLATCSKS